MFKLTFKSYYSVYSIGMKRMCKREKQYGLMYDVIIT